MNERLDNATRARLAKLATTPVDTSRLDAIVGDFLDEEAEQPAVVRSVFRHRLVGAVAACLVVAASIAIWYSVGQDHPIDAAPEFLSRMHDEVIAGASDSVVTSDIVEVRNVIGKKWSRAPIIPPFVVDKIECCCVHAINGSKAVCVLGRVEGIPVTMLVAHSQDMQEHSGAKVRNGYRFASHGKRNTISIKNGGRCVCLIGELPEEKLVAIARASGLIAQIP